MAKTKRKLFNVRLVLTENGFEFNDTCFMHRLAIRKNEDDEWIPASKQDRQKLIKIIYK
jgi:hypothetical protein